MRSFFRSFRFHVNWMFCTAWTQMKRERCLSSEWQSAADTQTSAKSHVKECRVLLLRWTDLSQNGTGPSLARRMLALAGLEGPSEGTDLHKHQAPVLLLLQTNLRPKEPNISWKYPVVEMCLNLFTMFHVMFFWEINENVKRNAPSQILKKVEKNILDPPLIRTWTNL